MTADLTTQLAGMTLPNPVLVASGCGGTGRELEGYVDLGALGGFVTRSVTLDRRPGAPTPRLVETPSGLLNAVGLPGDGLNGFLATDLPWLGQRRVRTIVSIAGSTLGEYAELARLIGNAGSVTAIEVNMSVPQPEEADDPLIYPASDPYHAAKVVRAVRGSVPRGIPVLAKLSPDVTRIVDLAESVVDAGADAVVLVNAALGLAVDAETLRPRLGAGYGGLSGPALRPIALRCVWQVHQAFPEVPIVGVGGIGSGAEALSFLAAGATAVAVGTAVLHDPTTPSRVLAELAVELDRLGIPSVSAAVGLAHRAPGVPLRDPHQVPVPVTSDEGAP